MRGQLSHLVAAQWVFCPGFKKSLPLHLWYLPRRAAVQSSRRIGSTKGVKKLLVCKALGDYRIVAL